MKLGIEIRYQDRKLVMPMERIRHAEKIGFDAVFAPEGHGSDSLTPLAFIAAHTSRIKLGSCITQIVGRTPTTTAMAFQTLEQLAGRGRVMAGLGSAMRETVEGWHGLPWGSPVSRMRDYVAIMRQAFDPFRTVDYRGKEWSIPYRGPNALPMQPMRSYLDTNPDIPILIGCGGTSMIKLTGEIADGWFPLGFAPGMMKTYAPMLEEGFKKAGNGKGFHNFDIWLHVDVNVHDDVREAMRPFKADVVQWAQLGREQMGVRGYGDLADRIIELQRGGRHQEAIDAVPDEYIDEGWLVGPLPRIGERFKRWLDSDATGIIIRHGPQLTDAPPPEHLEVYSTIAKAAGK